MYLPLISIVMPSLNQARFITAAIDSVLQQDYPNIELIIADGGSSDGTQELLQRRATGDARLRWFSEKDNGPAQALNRALLQTRGTVIGWLNSDDLYTPGAVTRAMAAFDAIPQTMMVYGHGQHVDEAGDMLNRYPTLPPSTPASRFSEGCFICQPTVFFRRTQFVLLGKLDESLKCAFDMDYWLRAFLRFPERIGFVDTVQAFSRLHEDCITLRQRRAVILEGMQVLAHHLGHASKEWVLTYANELLAAEPDGESVADIPKTVLSLLKDAAALLNDDDMTQLEQRFTSEAWLKSAASRPDIEPAPAAHAPQQQNDSTPPAVANSAQPDATQIQPNQLIQQHSVSEHLQYADAYFDGRDDHWYLYQKPFYHPTECAPMLSNLGDLFAGIKLQAGMRVLDFAAGSCWLSRILVQLGCSVISCDASQKALDIGRELFRRYPAITKSAQEPAYLLFTGESLDLPDKCVDRVIVNDAFHHIPNTATVLRELCRVLKDDGILGMSEPGRHHSKTAASQFEMRTYNVIENDFVLEDIWHQAQQAGFQDIRICPVIRQHYLSLEKYKQCIDGNVPPEVTAALAQDTVNHSIFFLHKQKLQGLEKPAVEIKSQADFDEAFYFTHYKDVADAVARGEFRSGWEHYEKFGRNEGRRGNNK